VTPAGLATLVLAGMLAVSGCAAGGSAGDSPSPDPGKVAGLKPAGTPNPPVTPAAGPAPNTRTIKGEGFSIAVNPAFQQTDETARNGEPVLVLIRPSGIQAINTGVTVFRDPAPASDVFASSYALEVAKRTMARATDIQRSQVEWPGATAAVLVQWTQRLPTSGGNTEPVRYWQLNAQIKPKLVLIAVGFSPVSAFDDSGVAEAISSFRPSSS
jgi:hypothetical protein